MSRSFFDDGGTSQPTHDVKEWSARYYADVNMTVFVWHGNSLDPYATALDHDTDTFAPVTQVGTNDLEDDDHGAPTIVRDDTGTLHVFFGEHSTVPGGGLQHATSDNPNDVTAWTEQANIQPDFDQSYINPHNYNGDLYLLYREDEDPRNLARMSSTDDGETWSSPTEITDLTGNFWSYPTSTILDGQQIHTVWVERDRSITDTNEQWQEIYYGKYDLVNNEWEAANGTVVSEPLTETEANNNFLVFDPAVNSEPTTFADLDIDGNGDPHILFGWNNGTEWGWYHTYWSGSSWSSETKITTKGGQFGRSAIEANSPSDISTWLSTNTAGAGDRAGNIERWGYDGSSWSQDSVIYDQSEYSEGAGNVILVGGGNYNDDAKIYFSQVDVGDFANSDLKILALDSNDEFVTNTTQTTNTSAGTALNTGTAAAITTTANGTHQTTGVISSGTVLLDFNDGNIDSASGDTADFQTVTLPVWEGSHALEGAVDNNVDSAIVWGGITVASGTELRDYVQAVEPDSAASTSLLFGVGDETSPRQDCYRADFRLNSSSIRLSKFENGSFTDLGTDSVSVSAETFYNRRVEWGSDGSITFRLLDTGGTELGSVSATDSAFSSGHVGYLVNSTGGDPTTGRFDLLRKI